MVLYEWDVVTRAGRGHKRPSVGVTDEEQRACDRMLEALSEIPSGVPASGCVTVVYYAPSLGGYMRYQPRMRAWRDACGCVRWDVDGHDA